MYIKSTIFTKFRSLRISYVFKSSFTQCVTVSVNFFLEYNDKTDYDCDVTTKQFAIGLTMTQCERALTKIRYVRMNRSISLKTL